MSYLQRMEKRHPGLRSFLTVLLSAVMVLNSVPTQALAEVVNEPQVMEIESVEEETDATLDETKATEGEQPADEQSGDQQDESAEPEGEQEEVVASDGEQATEEELADDQSDEQGEVASPLLAAPAPLTAQADGETTYTVEFYNRDGSSMEGKPFGENLYLFRYITDASGNVLGYDCPQFDSTLSVTVGNTFTVPNGGGTITYDPAKHTLEGPRLFKSNNAPAMEYNIFSGDWSTNPPTWHFESYKGYDQFEGYRFEFDSETNTYKLTVDYIKQLEVDLSYVGSDTGESANATIIIHGSTSSGQHRYYKLPINRVSYGSGSDRYTINNSDWLTAGGDSASDAYSTNWDMEALLFPGDVAVSDISSNSSVYTLAGYLIKTGGIIENEPEGDNQLVTLPVTLDGTPLDSALTPEDVLGDAVDFGVVAGTLDQGGSHTETNFAVKNYIQSANIDLDYDQNSRYPFYVANANKLNLTKSNGAPIDSPADIYATEEDIAAGNITVQSGRRDGDTSKIIPTPKEMIEAYVEALINSVQNTSDEMASKTTIKPGKPADQNNVIVDTRDFADDATIYVDASNLTSAISAGALKIKKKPNQYIVLNFPTQKTVSVKTFEVDDGTRSTNSVSSAKNDDQGKNHKIDELIFEHICFNAPQATTLNITDTSAMFVAPRATDVNNSNGAGWIVASADGTVHSTGSEWHFYHKSNYKSQPTGELTFVGTKQIIDHDGEAEDRTVTFKLKDASGNTVSTGTVNVVDGNTESITFDPAKLNFVLGAEFEATDTDASIVEVPGKLSLAKMVKDKAATVSTDNGYRVWTFTLTAEEDISAYEDLTDKTGTISITVRISEDASEDLYVLECTMDPESADFVNEEEQAPEVGPLTITKTFGGPATAEELATGAITIEVTTVVGGKTMYLTKGGELTETPTSLALGEADGFDYDEESRTWTKAWAEVPAGDYKVSEKNAAVEGYDLAPTSVTEVAKATVTKDGAATAELKDEYTEQPGSLSVTKVVSGVDKGTDVNNEYQITITNKAGEYLNEKGELQKDACKLTIKSGKTLTFDNLPVDTYTVVETDDNLEILGYAIPIKKVEGAGNVTAGGTSSVTITNTYTKTSVSISKVDVTGGDEVAGAHIQIIDFYDKVVDEWDSTTEPHTVTGLNIEEQYKLRETVAPKGYAITADTTFSLNDDGTIDTENTTTTVSEDGVLLVEDKCLTGKATVSLEKQMRENIPWDAPETFTFKLTDESGKLERTATAGRGETAKFGDIEISGVGDTYYQITEVVPTPDKRAKHVTYDENVHWAKVTAVANEANDGLDITVKYGDSKETCTQDKLVITNEFAAPALEKYINKDVHQDLPAFDTPFTYDILAFVTRDANRVVITDPMVKGIRFLNGAKTKVTVQDIGADNDHTAHGTVEQAKGTDVKFTATVDDVKNVLTVDIPDATAHRGHWVRVTYQVVLNNHVVSDEADYVDNDVPIDTNRTVISPTYPTHDGVETFASYIVYAQNGDYPLEANHITVTPPVEKFTVTKKWVDANGKEIAWPKDATVTIELMGNGKTMDKASAEVAGEDKAIERMIVTLDAKNPTGTFAELPIYESVTYSVVETKVTGVDAGFSTVYSGDETQGFVVTNSFTSEKKQDGSKKLPQTSDPTMALNIAALGLAGVGSALVAGGVAARKRREED